MTPQAIRKDTIEDARICAKSQSFRLPRFYHYIVWSTSGYYLVDYIGILFSDETLVETYKNGGLQEVIK